MSLKKSSFLFSIGTLFSRFSGLLRDSVLSTVFGAGHLMDAFNIAFRIPNLFRDMLAEGALGSAFTKIYSEQSELDQEQSRILLVKSLQAVLLLLSIFTTLGIVFAGDLVSLMTMHVGKDYDPVIENATTLTQILFPFLAIASINAVLSGVLHQKGSFFSSALSPIIGNVGYIFGALVLGKWFAIQGWFQSYGDPEIIGLSIGVMVGAICQLLGILYLVRNSFAGLKWSHLLENCWSPNVKRVFYLSFPMVLASSVGPINGLINTNFASSLGTGAVSWLNYAFRILQLPVGLFGVAVGIVSLPSMTRAIVANNGQVNRHAIKQLENSLGLIFFLMTACFSFYVCNSKEIIALIFQQGQFTAIDTVETGNALLAYSFGLVAYGLIKVLTSFYYAIERTKYPMRVSIAGLGTVLVFSYLLIKPLAQVGLAISSSIGLSMNALLLLFGLRSYWSFTNKKMILKSIGFCGFGVGLSVGAQLFFKNMLGRANLEFPLKIQLLVDLTISGILVALAFLIVVTILLGQNPKQLIQQFRSKRK